MTIQELKLLCESSNNFTEIVHAAIQVLDQYDLSVEFEVSESTISRWANGTSQPLPRLQKLVIAAIKRRASIT